MDLDNPSPEVWDALAELVHDQANDLAINTINSGESVEWLTANGWTRQDIASRLREMVTPAEQAQSPAVLSVTTAASATADG